MIDTTNEKLRTKDAVELLLEGRPHPTAQTLLEFHRANPTFFVTFASEFFWLKKRARPVAAEVIFQFLRESRHWQGVNDVMVDDHIFPLLSRVCILLYPVLNGARLELRQCEADKILGTVVVPRGGGKTGMELRASEATRLELDQLPPAPTPPEVQRRSRRHKMLTAEESAWVLPYIRELIRSSPHPRSHDLRTLSRHAKTQPEVFALAEKKLMSMKRPRIFSTRSIFLYSRQTAKRTGKQKTFTLSGQILSLYCRALIMRNPRFNGWCEFKEDSAGKLRKGHANALLGCSLAPEPANGEPYRRLVRAAPGLRGKPLSEQLTKKAARGLA